MTTVANHGVTALRAAVRIAEGVIELSDIAARGDLSHVNINATLRQMAEAQRAIQGLIDACRTVVNEAAAEEQRKDEARERRLRLLRDDPERDD